MKRLVAGGRWPCGARAGHGAQQAAAPPDDPSLQAMRDELERSRKLSLPNLEPPYFVQYLIDESENFSRLGQPGRPAVAAPRRGSARPKCAFAWATTSSTTPISRAAASTSARATTWSAFRWRIAIDVLRRYLWLETDSAYKSAVEAISRKRAALRNITQSEQLNDFAHAEPVQRLCALSEARRSTRSAGPARVRDALGAVRAVSRRSRIPASNWSRAPAAITW